MDFWWDGQGVGSCWQPASDAGSEPLALPACGAASVNRWLPEPARAMKMYVCSDYSLSEARLPGSCEWFGASGLERAEVRWTLGEALVLAAVVLLLWARFARRGRGGTAAAIVTLAGLARRGVRHGVRGHARSPRSAWRCSASAGWASGWRCGRAAGPALGWLTVALGVLALAGAVDRGIVMLPWVPVGPVWARILLELVWVPWALVAILRRERNRAPAAAVG